jgi:C-terminal processing protease CtpA/Prc
MRKKNVFVGILFAAILFIPASCVDDTNQDVLVVNTWISDIMNDYYYWYNEIPSENMPDDKIDPIDYFTSLLYAEEDDWSFITDDYTALMSEFEGTPVTMGYGPAFGRFYGSDEIFIIVTYTYENSPAQKAGLKRGDIILKVDNVQLSLSNYQELLSKDSYTVTLGEYKNNTIYETTKTIAMTAETLNTNPDLYHTVFQNYGGKNIGYICISEFLDKEPFVNNLQPVFTEFKAQGIRDLIVDLRYNGGGSMDAAIWLASVLAPQSAVSNESLFVQLEFNDKLQAYMESQNETEFSFDKTVSVNLNLENVYFLSTLATASASELVIVGLKPYMNVMQVGEYTYGKYTGMWAIPDTETPARHNYGILPIVMKYANALGFTNFRDGLAPYSELEDNLTEAYPLGDPNDPLTAQALSLISGLTKSGIPFQTKTLPYQIIKSPKQKLKSNLFLR